MENIDINDSDKKSKSISGYIRSEAEKYNKSPSNVLLSATCAAFAAAIAYGISLIFPQTSFIIMAILGAIIGATFPIYIARGKEWAKIEDEIDLKIKQIYLKQIEADFLKNLHATLPDTAPDSLKSQIWEKYTKLLDSEA